MGHRVRITSIMLLLGLAVYACKPEQEKPLPTMLKLPGDSTVTPLPNVIFVTATPETPIPIVATETASPTPGPGTAAPTPTTVAAVLPTQLATRTATPTQGPPATMTPSFTPTETDTPVTPGSAGFSIVGAVPGEMGSTGVTGCATVPQGGFGTLFQSDPNIQAGLGCALSGSATSASSAYQPFDNGVMFWVSSLGPQPQPVIYVLYNNGTYQRYNDTFREGDPSSSGAVAPEGHLEPVRGFGKVWRDIPGVRDSLGWATSGESGGAAQIQLFERGEMVYVSQAGQTYILLTGAPGNWSARAGGS